MFDYSSSKSVPHMRNNSGRRRWIKLAILVSFACLILYAGRHHSIAWFARDFIAANNQKDSVKVEALTLQESADKIQAKYGYYLELMVRSPDGYYLIPDPTGSMEITEEPLGKSQRTRWFNYLSQPETVHHFQVRLKNYTLHLYCSRTLTGWRHVIHDPSEFLPDK